MYTHAPARDTRHAGKYTRETCSMSGSAPETYTRTHYRGAAHRENTGEVLQRAGEYHEKTPGAHQIRTRPRETPAHRGSRCSVHYARARLAPGECDAHHTGSNTPRPAHHRTHVRDAPAKKTPGHRGNKGGAYPPPTRDYSPVSSAT